MVLWSVHRNFSYQDTSQYTGQECPLPSLSAVSKTVKKATQPPGHFLHLWLTCSFVLLLILCYFLSAVHRLDRLTSGVLIFARYRVWPSLRFFVDSYCRVYQLLVLIVLTTGVLCCCSEFCTWCINCHWTRLSYLLGSNKGNFLLEM